MAGESTTSAEVEADVGGQKVKYSGPLGTLVQVLILSLVSVVAFVTWNHAADTKEAGAALVAALRDQTSALRENTCAYTAVDVAIEKRGAFCKQVTR